MLPEHLIHRYGTVGGLPVPGAPRCWRVADIIEKPTPTQAELRLETPGLRRGHYLCFSGLHILPAELFEHLGRRISDKPDDQWGELTPVLGHWAHQHPYHLLALQGRHQDIGTKYGLLEAQLERALLGPDRLPVLARLGEAMAKVSLMHESNEGLA